MKQAWYKYNFDEETIKMRIVDNEFWKYRVKMIHRKN